MRKARNQLILVYKCHKASLLLFSISSSIGFPPFRWQSITWTTADLFGFYKQTAMKSKQNTIISIKINAHNVVYKMAALFVSALMS